MRNPSLTVVPEKKTPHEIEFRSKIHRYERGWYVIGTEDIVFFTVCELIGRANKWTFHPRTVPFDSGNVCITCWAGVHFA